MGVLGTAALASLFTPTGHIQSMKKVEKERQAAARQEKKKKIKDGQTLPYIQEQNLLKKDFFLIKVKLRMLCNTLFLWICDVTSTVAFI